MIKKRVLCSSVILTVLLLSKLYSNPQTDLLEDPFRKALDQSMKANVSQTLADKKNKEIQMNSIQVNFANEDVPLEEEKVKRKLDKYLKQFSYLKKSSHHIHRKADVMLPKISKILQSYGIPDDFKYVAVVESSLNPGTTSHKGAGGYWQFIPSTARLYGLKVNGKVDERTDLTKSTHAAARYLKSLYKEFGDWTLVAAAYNVGGNRLKASLRNQKKDSYYDLQLNAETASYVYKIISMKTILDQG